MNHLWLLLKNLLFTLLVPGFVVGWVPLHWFERHPTWPAVWRGPQYAAVVLGGIGCAAFLSCQWLFATRGQGTPAPFDPLQSLIDAGVVVKAVETFKGWMEVDTFEDYQRAWAAVKG